MINLNPVVGTKHFQYRVDTFVTKELLTNAKLIGKIVYYALTAADRAGWRDCVVLRPYVPHGMKKIGTLTGNML